MSRSEDEERVNFDAERDTVTATRKRSAFLGPNLHFTKNKLLKWFLSLFTNVKCRFFIFRVNLSTEVRQALFFYVDEKEDVRKRAWNPSSHAEHPWTGLLVQLQNVSHCPYSKMTGPTSNPSSCSGRPRTNFSHTIPLEKALFIYETKLFNCTCAARVLIITLLLYYYQGSFHNVSSSL